VEVGGGMCHEEKRDTTQHCNSTQIHMSNHLYTSPARQKVDRSNNSSSSNSNSSSSTWQRIWRICMGI